MDSCEDLGGFGCLGMEIVEKPKKCDFWCDFRSFESFSIGVPSGNVGGCSGDDGGVYFAAGGGLGVKKSK